MTEEQTMQAMVGQTIKKIEGLEKDSEEVRVFTAEGREFLFTHYQDCCENVALEDFEADLSDLEGALIISAEVVTDNDQKNKPHEWAESWTWTFYKIETNRGGLWMRWLGESSGYYSESVDLRWVNQEQTNDN